MNADQGKYIAVTVIQDGNSITSQAVGPVLSQSSIPDATPLTAGSWTEGTLSTAITELWYSFTATSGITYRIWWDDEHDGSSTKTVDIAVYAQYANGTVIFGSTGEGVDAAWDTAQSFTPTATTAGTIYIRVRPAIAGRTGTFGITYSTSATRPTP